LKLKLTRLAFAGALVAGLVAGISPAAHAGDDSTKRVLAAVGSDTTTFAVRELAAAYNVDPTYNPDGDRIVNVPPLHSVSTDLAAAEAGIPSVAWKQATRQAWPGGEVVKADGDCVYESVFGGEGAFDNNNDGDVLDGGDTRHTILNIDLNGDTDTTDAGETIRVGAVAPDGSSAGRTFALDSANNPLGCVDLARSSSAPSVAQRPNFDSWGIALDAIGWTKFPGNLHGVLNISRTQLGNMYTCSAVNVDNSSPADGDFDDVGDQKAGEPKVRFWGDLSGNPGDLTRIKGYRIQLGSGTGQDVATLLLGLSAATDIGLNCTGGADAWFPTVQEHDCRGVSDVNKPDAVCFYGFSRWTIQKKLLETDKRNGATFGNFFTGSNTPLPPATSTIKEAATGRYEGTRIVYTLVTMNHDGSGQDLPGFNDAITFTGVEPDPDGAGPLLATPGYTCAKGNAQKILKAWGLKPFTNNVTDATNSTYGKSYCRHNLYALP
jgi:hypothetical protein